MAARDHFETVWIKKEVTDEEPDESASTVQAYSPSEDVKEELEDGVNKEFLEEPLGNSWSTDFIKKDPELNLEVDEIENIVVTPTFEPDTIRLIQNGYTTSFGETVDQEELHNDLEKGTEESRYFAMPDTHLHGLTEKEGSLFNTRLKCSWKEKEFHRYRCSCCLQSFPSKYRLIRHVFIHIDGVQAPKHICKSCGTVFTTSFNLKRHLKINQTDEALSSGHNDNYQCSYTKQSILLKDGQDTSTTQQTEMQTSVNDHIGPVSVKSAHKCDVCGESFTRLNCLKWHALTHSGVRPHKCDTCGKAFTRLSELKNHILIHTGERPHLCDICGKTFSHVSHLYSHTAIHTGIKPHTCDSCGKAFFRLSGLQRHLSIHTKIRQYKCEVCGKSFTHQRNLKSHALIHSEIRPHSCVCGKAFTKLYDLKKHALIHSDIKPYECDVCGKAFTLKRVFKKHCLIHTGIKRFKCDVCEKSFSQLCHLKVHSIVHAGVKPHKCDVCGKSFTQASYLKSHSLIHTGESPYKCDVCDKVFGKMFNLRRHVSIHAAD